MSLFHFLRPEWFIAILPLFFLYWQLQRLRLQNKSWQNFCDKDLLPHLFEQSQLQQKKRPLYLLLIAGLIAIIALAGPSWEKRAQPVFKKQSALILILDLSRSMDASDIKPSRLSRAILKVEDILKQRKEGQTALIVFAADAFTVTPLTEDTETISSQVKSLNTAMMPAQGSNAGKAIKLAHELFKRSSQIKGHVLVITDGINDEAITVTESTLSPDYTLSVLGIGTTDGAPIALADGSFFKDRNGAIVIPKLNHKKLHQLAAAGSGTFRSLTTNDSDIQQLLKPVNSALENNLDSEQSQTTGLNTDSWFEAGPWLLLILLPLAAFAFRKGYLFILIIITLPQAEPAYAFDLNNLWKNDNQQARELLENDKAAEAVTKFSDNKWKAAAEYKSGQYQNALQTYQQLNSTDPEILYNLANTQAQLGQLDQALENYNKVIASDPDHADAKFNRELVEKQKKQQKKSGKDGKENNDNKGEQGDPSENQQNNSSDDKSESGQDKTKSDNKDSADNKSQQKNSDDSAQNKSEQNSSTAEQDKPKQDQNKPTETADRESQSDNMSKEQQQASEQWLRRIPDDPGGLLRRKFKYQSDQRQNQKPGEQQW